MMGNGDGVGFSGLSLTGVDLIEEWYQAGMNVPRRYE